MAQPSHTGDGAPMRAPGVAQMPGALRGLLLALLGALLAGAGYLIAVRGEALILDLSAVSQRIFCF